MSYYYLISGLPDLSLSMQKGQMDFNSVFNTIRTNLEPEDEKQFRYLLYPHDNRNLLNILFHEYGDFRQLDFMNPTVISETAVKDYKRQKASFPAYIEEFLHEYEEHFYNMSIQEIENRLWEKFYEEVSHQSVFIVDYFSFERKLKIILSAYNSSYFNFLALPQSSNEDSILSQLGKGKSPPVHLLSEHPYLETLEETIATHQPEQIERFIDHIKWDYLDEPRGFFSREQVFSYTLKLMMVLRWQRIGSEQGIARYKELEKNIKIKTSVNLTQKV